MRTITAKDAKNNFGHLIDQARNEPVAISKHGRDVAVVLAVEDYDKLLSQTLMSNFENVEDVFPAQSIIQQHRDAGVPMYYTDNDTPEGQTKCLLPDGTVCLVADGEEIEWPTDKK